ncbi:hypothetical protein, partial [Pandoraea commovens]|uniref:hypothetical protein n=1 Tax=Pandoraea commovens TaxID=2508289 RepID=UPI001C2D12F4
MLTKVTPQSDEDCGEGEDSIPLSGISDTPKNKKAARHNRAAFLLTVTRPEIGCHFFDALKEWQMEQGFKR